MSEVLARRDEMSSSPLKKSHKEKIDNVSLGKIATMELWDMIHAPRRNRYSDAQKNRTLIHPSLPQPSLDDEKLIIVDDCESKVANENNSSDLHARLLAALEQSRSSLSTNSNTMKSPHDEGYFPSPTSTLNFPSDQFCMPLPTLPIDTSKDDVILTDQSRHAKVTDCSCPFGTKRCTENKRHSTTHNFVICADTQLGMTSQNEEWDIELEYSRKAVKYINDLPQTPAFVCVCGDLVDMEESIYSHPHSKFTREECLDIQDRQNRDFQRVWSQLDDRIALVCICGNHDVGNRPTRASIDRFQSAFGDDYLSFWANGTYNIVLNSCLFSDPSGAPDAFAEQLEWLEDRLKYANDRDADQIFVFTHHPWFLYDENETREDLRGIIPIPVEWGGDGDVTKGFAESYFPIDRANRRVALELFERYGVSACFAGHFHQNLLSKTSWGMDMIVTAPLSLVFDAPSKPMQIEENNRGLRIVSVEGRRFRHRFETLY